MIRQGKLRLGAIYGRAYTGITDSIEQVMFHTREETVAQWLHLGLPLATFHELIRGQHRARVTHHSGQARLAGEPFLTLHAHSVYRISVVLWGGVTPHI